LFILFTRIVSAEQANSIPSYVRALKILTLISPTPTSVRSGSGVEGLFTSTVYVGYANSIFSSSNALKIFR